MGYHPEKRSLDHGVHLVSQEKPPTATAHVISRKPFLQRANRSEKEMERKRICREARHRHMQEPAVIPRNADPVNIYFS